MRIDNDDTGIGTKRLKIENDKAKVTRPVQSTAAAELQPGRKTTPTAPQAPGKPAVDRRQGERRRQAERRQQQDEVMLDTRDHRERRRHLRRREDRARIAAKKPRGIDEEV